MDKRFLWVRFILSAFGIIQIVVSFAIITEIYKNLFVSNIERERDYLYEILGVICMILVGISLYYIAKNFLTQKIEKKFSIQAKVLEFLFVAGFLFFVNQWNFFRRNSYDVITCILSGIFPFLTIVVCMIVYADVKKEFSAKNNRNE
ncbi:MAG: hypothetical protein E7381_00090 [Clostridiales bacterium]|nr:hypothetical protein [Clostridiales bacterium]